MQRINPLTINNSIESTPKWKISSNFNVQLDLQHHSANRMAAYVNQWDKNRHDIYIYSYNNVKGLEIVYFICNRALAECFEKECKKLNINFKINDDYFTQIYKLHSSDKKSLVGFVTAINQVDPLFNIKEEMIQTVNFNFVSTEN